MSFDFVPVDADVHGIWGVLSAYQDTHEQRYLERARFFVDEWAKPWQDEHDGSFDDQLWMYGLQFEAYDKYYRITGDTEAARYNVRALDAMVHEQDSGGKWNTASGLTGINMCGFGYAYDYTGDEKYLERGLALLEKTAAAEGARVKTFAQQFRASPYFLGVLVEDYEPSRILD